jgi:hypothetical protein
MNGHAIPRATKIRKKPDRNAYLERATHIRLQGRRNSGPAIANPSVERAKKINATETSRPTIAMAKSRHRYGKSEAESCCRDAI